MDARLRVEGCWYLISGPDDWYEEMAHKHKAMYCWRVRSPDPTVAYEWQPGRVPEWLKPKPANAAPAVPVLEPEYPTYTAEGLDQRLKVLIGVALAELAVIIALVLF